jgi:hypothetical protein
MPTNRRVRNRTHTATYDGAMRVHLQERDCYLAGAPGNACACGLTDANGNLRVELARRMWREHRDEILVEWKGDAPPWAAIEFDR